VLRTFQDSDALHAILERGGRLVVVGAGWIGCEVAASARQKGMEVAVVEPQSVPLQGVLGAELGAFYRDVHADHGVALHLGTGVEAIEGAGRAERVRTSDGTTLDCDAVVLGVGVAPRTGLAEGVLAVDNGILVDAGLKASAEGVYAAGDVANHDHPLLGRLRVEHWANALEQGPAAARAMLGQDVTYDRVPYFFSDQYDVGMEYAGHSAPDDEVVFRGDPASREFIAFWLRDGRVAAGMNVNVWDVNEHIQALVRDGATVDPDRLRDPDVELEAIVAR
jgi:3-phenylpropionate/trans-cinnamate dioxygenase ferredoxin reductase subunit